MVAAEGDDDDGTVYVRVGDQEHVVGQYPEGTPDEALAFFTKRYDALAFEDREDALWRMQRALLRGIADRWFQLPGNPVWAGLALDGIYHLLRAMRTPKVIVRVASMLLPDHDVAPLPWTPTRTPLSPSRVIPIFAVMESRIAA